MSRNIIALTMLGAAISACGPRAPHGAALSNGRKDAEAVLRASRDGQTLLLRLQGEERALSACADKPLQEVAAPQGKLIASVYERNCGATVDFATHVAIRSGNSRYVVAIFEGRPRVTIIWKRTGLEVRHSPLPSESVFQKLSTAIGVSVSYELEGIAVAPTPQDQLDFANVNYGATGRAAGVPAEALLQSAGWSQEASGLYRNNWGHWNGVPPYGDDPRGSVKIREGIQYYEGRYSQPK